MPFKRHPPTSPFFFFPRENINAGGQKLVLLACYFCLISSHFCLADKPLRSFQSKKPFSVFLLLQKKQTNKKHLCLHLCKIFRQLRTRKTIGDFFFFVCHKSNFYFDLKLYCLLGGKLIASSFSPTGTTRLETQAGPQAVSLFTRSRTFFVI